ncbi:MAG: Arylsulfatase [Microbacterium sp.]|jgi:arylsulfatase A-like enzyme|uniref:sulfatase n=1 Tax=Microbacterium sp. TaxID=51671 RepID=UPI002618717A|nr:sulfatase [Microbacterium sp.]MDF2560277.1 Arylsulfatase [Microbacterium sp.]
MRAIMVMFDTLNRRFLPPYGAEREIAPNFTRLAERAATFDTCYAGSMPCIPARRELHTGRYNFLHRSWGPLEPFDDSVPEMLKNAGVYTHLVTDHKHYWSDGAANYHTRYTSFEFFRGQEGDPWKGHVADPVIPEGVIDRSDPVWRQDWVNRRYFTAEADHPQTRTFDAGLDFIQTNRASDHWFVQIEAYDPHEPFLSYARYRSRYGIDEAAPHFDWPSTRKVIESAEEVQHARAEYSALLSMCDASLGRVLAAMDECEMWDDTLLIVCTDHGLLLGEHEWWGKNVQPWYDETIHTPLFIWDPRTGVTGHRRGSLVQTIDLGPTLLEFFGVSRTADMQGKPLRDVIASDTPVRDAALFGSAAGHVNVTDGRYVYMRACVDETNSPVVDYTLMPARYSKPLTPDELRTATLVAPLSFSKGTPVLRIEADIFGNPHAFGTLLFDLVDDPLQERPLRDPEIELLMATKLVELMRRSDAPDEQYIRLGLPAQGPVGAEHLVIERQWPQVVSGRQPVPRGSDFAPNAIVGRLTLRELFCDDQLRMAVVRSVPSLDSAYIAEMAGGMTLIEVAAMRPEMTVEVLRTIETDLADLVPRGDD